MILTICLLHLQLLVLVKKIIRESSEIKYNYPGHCKRSFPCLYTTLQVLTLHVSYQHLRLCLPSLLHDT